jgi:hypothetical protein
MLMTKEAAAALPEWQRGIPLDLLRSYASIFKARHKDLVFGAFGLTKERDIADALAAKALLWKRGPDGAPVAAAIAKVLRNAGSFHDFAGRAFEIPRGHIKVAAFACHDPEAGAAVLRALLSKGPPVWLENFEEDETARAALRMVPEFRYLATKIAAGSEVKGLYSSADVSAAPLHAAEAASILPVVHDFASIAERDAMLAEADAFATWAQHYSSYNKRHSWTAYALRGFDADDPTFIIKPAEMSQSWKAENPQRMTARPAWTKACAHFPQTMKVVHRILDGRDADRVRLMRLAPKGELSRHADITDRDAGLADGRLCRLHLPLRTSPAVIVHGWSKRGHHTSMRFPAGALCYLDQRGPHRVENTDPTLDRVHLVLDVHSDARLRDLIAGAM